jgi:hypothetical protein
MRSRGECFCNGGVPSLCKPTACTQRPEVTAPQPTAGEGNVQGGAVSEPPRAVVEPASVRSENDWYQRVWKCQTRLGGCAFSMDLTSTEGVKWTRNCGDVASGTYRVVSIKTSRKTVAQVDAYGQKVGAPTKAVVSIRTNAPQEGTGPERGFRLVAMVANPDDAREWGGVREAVYWSSENDYEPWAKCTY